MPEQSAEAGASPHSRLVDQLTRPLDNRDPDAARTVCASVTRRLLGDLAPALLLLPASERVRFQALATYVRTLVDFALDRGMHGERLARINRWEYELEQALDGTACGQPAFIAMAAAEKRHPWDRDTLDDLAAAARQLALTGDARAAAAPLVTASWRALAGEPPSRALTEAAGRLVAAGAPGAVKTSSALDTKTADSAGRQLRAALDTGEAALLPISWHRFLIFVAEATDLLAAAGSPARLGLWQRLRLLLRARLAR